MHIQRPVVEIGEISWLIRIESGKEIVIETEPERGIETEIGIVKKAERAGAAENAIVTGVEAGSGMGNKKELIMNTDGGTEVTIGINTVRANGIVVM